RRLRVFALFVASVWIAASIAAGSAIATPNGVMAWGANESGELGDGTTAQKDVPETLPAPSGVTQVSAGNEFSLALLENGKVMAWGENEFDELGLSLESGGPQHCGGFSCSKTPVEVPGLSEVTAISASAISNSASLAVRANGTVMEWGSTTEEEGPEEVAGLSEVTAVSEGASFSLALRANGTVMAWGSN